MRRFYADLYLGMIAAMDGDEKSAEERLRRAVANETASQAVYGLRYMWQIAVLEYDALPARAKTPGIREGRAGDKPRP